MVTDTMGRVTVTARIENLFDILMSARGLLPADEVRFVDVTDAIVDSGATMLSIPLKLVHQLGLLPTQSWRTATNAADLNGRIYGTARLAVQDRECTVDVAELPDHCPVLIGRIPLALLDFVVDFSGHRLIGNPAHGGTQMIELY